MAADHAPQPVPGDQIRAYRTRLKNEPQPSVVIDSATAEVLAANAGGLKALGLTPANRLPAPLDSAMPAIGALRAIIARGLTGVVHQRLMFWNSGRAASWPCTVTAADAITPAHVFVVFEAPSEQESQPAVLPVNEIAAPMLDAMAANDDAPSRVARSDQETLNEIARRIRQGHRPSGVVDSDAGGPSTTATSGTGTPRTSHAEPQSDFAASRTTEPKNASYQPDASRMRAPPASPPSPSPATKNAAVSLPASDIAALAHELKTPLSAIAAAAEIMRDERLGAMGNETYLGYAADIHASAMHAMEVIQEMLDSDAGRRAELQRAFDLSELAAGTVSSLQPLALERGLTLTLDAQSALTPVRANPTAIRQILINLLTNALKFTSSGGDVRVVTGYLDDGAVFMAVRDTGEGMDEATLMHVFSNTSRPRPRRPGSGRGIGLQLVRRLAAENGAEFEIESAPDIGTTVMISFAKD